MDKNLLVGPKTWSRDLGAESKRQAGQSSKGGNQEAHSLHPFPEPAL